MAAGYRYVLFDWGDTLMSEDGPEDIPMALWPEVRNIDGALETVATLARTHGIAIASNASVSFRPHIEQALARGGFHIPEIFCYRELGRKKSDPAFWAAVVAKLGHDLIMVGDDLENDVRAPRRFGIDAIWFNWKNREGTTDAPVLGHLRQLPALIADAERRRASSRRRDA